MANEGADRRRKGVIGGSLLIAYGVLGAIWDYYRDSTSMDYFAKGYAMKGAVLHLVLFGLAGLCVIGWYRRDPGDTNDGGGDRRY
jgi:prolipoprotein diacylglyceryltransferase